MSPRPRKVSDEDVFAAAFRVASRVGPNDFTLDAIAREAGVTASALVQRFGSKRALQIALADAAAKHGPSMVRELATKHASPLAALRAYGSCMSELATTPAAYVRNLAYLLEDLTDPELRRRLERQGRKTRKELEAIIQAAVTAGELAPSTDVASLARTIEAVVSGAMLSWAFYREGSAETWIAETLESVLAPYRVRRRRR